MNLGPIQLADEHVLRCLLNSDLILSQPLQLRNYMIVIAQIVELGPQ